MFLSETTPLTYLSLERLRLQQWAVDFHLGSWTSVSIARRHPAYPFKFSCPQILGEGQLLRSKLRSRSRFHSWLLYQTQSLCFEHPDLNPTTEFGTRSGFCGSGSFEAGILILVSFGCLGRDRTERGIVFSLKLYGNTHLASHPQM